LADFCELVSPWWRGVEVTEKFKRRWIKPGVSAIAGERMRKHSPEQVQPGSQPPLSSTAAKLLSIALVDAY